MTGDISDIQLIEMLNEYLSATGYHFMNFVGVLFAFLMVVYLVGEKLSKPMLAIVVALYSGFTIPAGGSVYLCSLWFTEIANELARRNVTSVKVMNYPVEAISGEAATIFRIAIYGLFLGAYIAGLLFLREVRSGRARATPNKSVESDT